jgi:multidrug efflux system membrane fusion protein
MTALMRLPVERIMTHRLTPAILTLDDEGRLGVRTVVEDGDGDDETKVVRFVPVEIVEDTADGLYVSGLPKDATLITVGQEFVKDGERVIAVPGTSVEQRESAPLTAERDAPSSVSGQERAQ